MTGKNIELEEIINGIGPIKKEWIETARDRTARLVMPPRALGKLHDIAEQLCGIKQTLNPLISRKVILIMAGDHGVVAEGVNPFPQEITGEMVRTFLAGGAGINVLARHVGAEVWVVDMGIIPELDPAAMDGGDRLLIQKVARGTANFAKGPAMSRQDAEKSILTGFNLASDQISKGADILGLGDMGIGNTTPSAAIGTVITGKSTIDMVGRGTGVDDEGLKKKQGAVHKGIRANQPDPRDGLDVLAKVGGFEIGGIAGSVLAGAYHRCPVVMDGFISSAGALIAHTLCPEVKDYLFAGHCSEEQGHRAMLEHLGCEPILNLGMRLGEGSGGALAIGIIEAAVKTFSGISTFEEAGVTEKES